MRNRFTSPFAIADIQGSDTTPNLRGVALFYPANETGIYIQVEVFHLPDEKLPNSSGFFIRLRYYLSAKMHLDQIPFYFGTWSSVLPHHAKKITRTI